MADGRRRGPVRHQPQPRRGRCGPRVADWAPEGGGPFHQLAITASGARPDDRAPSGRGTSTDIQTTRRSSYHRARMGATDWPNEDLIIDLPKAEVHVHLEGCLEVADL